jgi:hypothetical protein
VIPRIKRRLALAIVAAGGLVLLSPALPSAHEIPARVTVLAFVKPEPGRLRLLVRVPLEAMRDVDYPLVGGLVDSAKSPTSSTLGLDIAKTEALMPEAVKQWIAQEVAIRENDSPLPTGRVVATRISLPSDRSFASYETALAHVTGPMLAGVTDLQWKQAMLDVLIEYPIASEQSRFSIDPALARLGLRTVTVLRFIPPNSPERAFEYTGDPGLVPLDPRWHQAALRFVVLGFEHIMDGIDHLLFVFCLVVPFRRFKPLVLIVTSFTVAHSITLLASAMGFAPSAGWFPPFIEVLVAASIVFMALENIVGPKLERRWLIAFGFGLVHGFAFSFALRESLQFAGRHLVSSLLAFNVGVELGQIAALLVAVPALVLLFRYVVAERVGTIILSALVAHTSWHWMTDRWATLREYSLGSAAMDASALLFATRALLALLILVAIVWAVRAALQARRRQAETL